ncbi:hypothetical protein ACFOZY_09985 [Chungangia koreensis]|uniref:Uncharacterized protein n=1 Tax=Chungangia koreensis TaxID=752657 RepID=A0ABV8X5R6_9LACT
MLSSQISYGNTRHFQMRNAEQSYRKHTEYMNTRKPSLTDLEDLLTGKKERELFRAGQVPLMIAKPGASHEETIQELENVRRESLSSVPPTALELRTAASASAKINEVRAQQAVDRAAERQIELEVDHLNKIEIQSREAATEPEYGKLVRRRQYELAVSKYAYQAEFKKRGFEPEQPSFFRIA